MDLEKKLPVSYLLFTSRGRIDRLTFLTCQLLIWSGFYILFQVFSFTLGYTSTLLIYPLLFWALYCTYSKRIHDSGSTLNVLWFTLIPFFGPFILGYYLVLKKGYPEPNIYGDKPGSASDYFKNDTETTVINDVTGLNPVPVDKVYTPSSIHDLIALIKDTSGPISVGGGRFSMGGQTASTESIHIDMREMNKVVEFSPENKTIKVEAGIRWCDIQRRIDPYDLSIKIMQTYANFTVGGSLSVNAHGRYMGAGPLILSVRSIDVLLANGEMVHASENENREIFFGAIGGYNGLGIIVYADLDLTDNTAVKRTNQKLPISNYQDYFLENVRTNGRAVFHNADIYPPSYKYVNATTWVETDEKPTVPTRLMPLKESYPIERYFLWAFSETPFGKHRRQYIVDPLLYLRKKVHWRNYEAGYDVAELEPRSRSKKTYVLLEYFVPIKNFIEFSEAMSEIFQRYNVNIINVSIRHAGKDSGSYLAWAKEEVFAFVVYYKQQTEDYAKGKVAIWTRELIDAVLAVNGTYYLPYQAHATDKQFHKAYPRAKELFKLKTKYDPDFRFRNVIWDTYYSPTLNKD